jgi:peptide/nickel transport system permease protein
MSINDTFVVIPLFPILTLFYFMMHDHMSWALLALAMASLGWPYDARLIRSVALSLRNREFTTQSVFSGTSTRQVLLEEHLPYVLPIVFSTTMNNINWSIGLEVTLPVIGFTDIETPSSRTPSPFAIGAFRFPTRAFRRHAPACRHCACDSMPARIHHCR